VLAGEDLSPAWSGRTVFLTNRHVVDRVKPRNGVACAGARIQFTQSRRSPEDGFRVKPEPLWRSPDAPVELDCVVLELVPGEGAAREAVPPPASTIEVGDRANLQPEGERIFIIGHPGGRDLSYSLYDNALVAIEPPLLYYRSPTEGGSSGSPVFDGQWQLVAIHHSHVGARTANRGTFIDAIRDAIAGG
jgi:hypothetical protein